MKKPSLWRVYCQPMPCTSCQFGEDLQQLGEGLHAQASLEASI